MPELPANRDGSSPPPYFLTCKQTYLIWDATVSLVQRGCRLVVEMVLPLLCRAEGRLDGPAYEATPAGAAAIGWLRADRRLRAGSRSTARAVDATPLDEAVVGFLW